MYIMRIDRPKRSLNDKHPNGTTVTLELTYSECITIDHALHEYEKHSNLTEAQKWFAYEFMSKREILKQGIITSLIPLVYDKRFGEKSDNSKKN